MAFGSTIGGWRGESDPGTGPRALRPWCCAVALGLALCLHGVGPAQAGEDEGALGSSFLSDASLDAGLDAEVETAFETDDASGQKFEVQVWPELVIDFPGGLSVTAMGRLRGDAFDELEPGSPAQDTTAPQTRRALIGDDVELELRELYAEKQLGDLHLTLGKQQVVWGQADGLKVESHGVGRLVATQRGPQTPRELSRLQRVGGLQRRKQGVERSVDNLDKEILAGAEIIYEHTIRGPDRIGQGTECEAGDTVLRGIGGRRFQKSLSAVLSHGDEHIPKGRKTRPTGALLRAGR